MGLQKKHGTGGLTDLLSLMVPFRMGYDGITSVPRGPHRSKHEASALNTAFSKDSQFHRCWQRSTSIPWYSLQYILDIRLQLGKWCWQVPVLEFDCMIPPLGMPETLPACQQRTSAFPFWKEQGVLTLVSQNFGTASSWGTQVEIPGTLSCCKMLWILVQCRKGNGSRSRSTLEL